MTLRPWAMVAGLAMGLMTGTAQAATTPIIYTVDFTVGSASAGSGNVAHVTGSITTDGTIGVLQAGNITAFSIASNGYRADSVQYALADELHSTTDGRLIFDFDADGTIYYNGAQAFVLYISDYNERKINALYNLDNGPSGSSASYATEYFDYGSTVVLGRVSPVPLPASAPMYGAALLALGAVGYGINRKKAAAAA